MFKIKVGDVREGYTIADQVKTLKIYHPTMAKRVMAHLWTTGDGFNNTHNCAEFCLMRQDFYVNGERSCFIPWRGNSERNPVSPQSGTWT